MKTLLFSFKAIILVLFIFAVSTASSSVHNNQTEDPDPFIDEVHPTTGVTVTLEHYDTSSGYHWYRPVPDTPTNSRNICMVKPSACQKDAEIE